VPCMPVESKAGNRVTWNHFFLSHLQFAVIEAAQERPVKAIELLGEIDEQHRLRASVPEELPVGPVRLIALFSEEDEAGTVWAHGLAREWADELSDSRQDLYTLTDGQPVDSAR